MSNSFTCKFCHTVWHKENETIAHISMCKGCYNALLRYQRLIVKKDLNEEEKQLIERINRQCQVNSTAGKYVPQYYNKTQDCICSYCGDTFISAGISAQCVTCKQKENAYRTALVRLNNPIKYSKKVAATVNRYEEYYYEQHAKGFKVPLIFYKLKNIRV